MDTQDKTLDDILEHFGVPGMKWGVRRTNTQLAKAATKRSGDSAKAEKRATKAKKEGVGSLTNKELQELNNRLNLEQNFSRLTSPTNKSKISSGQKALATIVGLGTTITQVRKLLKPATDAIINELTLDFTDLKI